MPRTQELTGDLANPDMVSTSELESSTTSTTSTPLTPQSLKSSDLVLVPSSRLDIRSDQEITAWLQTPHPITSDKNVWAFWHSGFSQMSPWVQRNVINWVRRLGPEWTVHILDRVPGSATNISHIIDSSFFPAAFNEHTMSGPHVGPHSADLIRLPLLYLYGGVWMDAGTFLFRHIDDICWKIIEDPNTPYQMAGFVIEIRPDVDAMLNGFIAAKRGNGFIKRWHDIYVALWEGATESKGFHAHPLLRHLPLLSPPVDKLNCPDLGVLMEAFSDYLAHFLCFERLRKLVDPADGFDGPKYYRENMFLVPAMQETYYFQMMTGWNGIKQFDLLATRRDGVHDEKYLEAEKFVDDMLANTSTMKLSHGPPGALSSFLADLWDDPKNHHADNEPGTFAAYLRYGSVHLDQTRVLEPLQAAPTTEEVLHVGVIEVPA
ncbi:hypothetical protein V501_06305 [Pseudogymnoascus sp. VKM F-4519 (FW-2642)]|nr:hypothetical protein V501_06305 [Pseudogymnoascus sp. VKM F-4519 (FW-2642)]